MAMADLCRAHRPVSGRALDAFLVDEMSSSLSHEAWSCSASRAGSAVQMTVRMSQLQKRLAELAHQGLKRE
jgi:hypothetical protein